MDIYKTSALVGTVIMGVSSFVACLAQSGGMIAAGNIGLVVSIVVMSYGFSKWQP
jgi:precorrin-2 methylase